MKIQSQRASLHLAALVAVALAAQGCKRDEITHFQVKKPSAAQPSRAAAPDMGGPGMGSSNMGGPGMGAPPGMGMGAPPGMQGDVPEPPSGKSLKWKLPKGWSQTPGSAMRYATIKPAAPGKVDVSVVVLAGEAGGELANVNRWRGQIGLAALDQAALSKARKEVKSPAGSFAVYDFTSEGQVKSRMVAALANIDGSTWFLKMVGDAAPVGASQPEFLQLLRSVSRDAAK